MDIAGAKALKERLGHKGKAPPPATSAEVSADAPPVYHYLGVSDAPSGTPTVDADEGPKTRRSTWLRRLSPQRR